MIGANKVHSFLTAVAFSLFKFQRVLLLVVATVVSALSYSFFFSFGGVGFAFYMHGGSKASHVLTSFTYHSIIPQAPFQSKPELG